MKTKTTILVGKKTATLLLLPLFACLPAGAQRLQLNKQTIDCGKTGFEVPVSATFELRNKGLRKMVVSDVKADCGCTQTELSKREAGPGERIMLTVTYDARLLGHFDKQVAVTTNATKKPVYLRIKGVVLADYQDFKGNYPYDFGGLLSDVNNVEFDNVNRGDNPEMEFHIVNNSSSAMTPNVLHLPPYLTAIVSPEQLAPGRAGKVTLMLNSEKLHDYGLTQTSVYLAKNLGEKINSSNELPVATVLLPDLTKFEGEGRQQAPQLQLSATDINLGEMGAKSKKAGEVTLTNTGQTTLKISSLQMFTPGLRVTLKKRELQPGEQTKLKVTAFADGLRKARSKPRVLMITNDPAQAKVVIYVNVK